MPFGSPGLGKCALALNPAHGFVIEVDRLQDFETHPENKTAQPRLPMLHPYRIVEAGYEGALEMGISQNGGTPFLPLNSIESP